MKRFIMILFWFVTYQANAVNVVTYSVLDSLTDYSEDLKMRYKSVSNDSNRTRISFELISSNAPFTIYEVQWVNCDKIVAPLDSFSFIAHPHEVIRKKSDWRFTIDFPFSDRFAENDVLILNTDKGVVKCPLSRAGELKDTINVLQQSYTSQIDAYKNSANNVKLISIVVLTIILVTGGAAIVITRRRFIKKKREVETLAAVVAERTNRNLELEQKVTALYGSRLDTLNMLCNEYFEKSDSDKVRLSLYNEVEKHILSLRDSGSITELEKIVNKYRDGILLKIKEQIPELKKADYIFLVYLYAGFSPRAVCIFTDIKLKNFYNRRSRLRDKILGSDATDREYFASQMLL